MIFFGADFGQAVGAGRMLIRSSCRLGIAGNLLSWSSYPLFGDEATAGLGVSLWIRMGHGSMHLLFWLIVVDGGSPFSSELKLALYRTRATWFLLLPTTAVLMVNFGMWLLGVECYGCPLCWVVPSGQGAISLCNVGCLTGCRLDEGSFLWGPLSMDGHNAVDKSQCMNLGNAVTSAFEQEATSDDNSWQTNEQLISSTSPCLAHAISKELVIDVKDSINSFAVLQISEDSAEQEEGAKECKSSIGPGVASKLEDSVQRSELPMRADEENGIFPVQQLFDRMGSDSQFPPSDVMLSTPDLDSDWCG
ncbi:hypothetical protein Nepgr_007955 [Nepenthes gracilis]|uniref:Uncharacterized protein n=1 Tax=Nepenthes gracilis TaxID=150966 RepID=A0AAD3S817_NEPGR|nr:hypothetical protein Nepgr_007955 [Nepenthes gracilis]